MTELTPREIVSELDKFIIGQNSAKKAVAIALRSRWRRKKVDSPLREEIFPKNILMIGPTGVGKTEISRRLSKLASAPFLKVEATKFTEVGYVGRDVDQIVRDLIDSSIVMTKDKMRQEVETKAHAEAEKRVIKALTGEDARPQTIDMFKKKLRDGLLDDKEIELDIEESNNPMSIFEIPGQPGSNIGMMNLNDIFGKALEEGNFITVNYITSSGDSGNGVSNFTFAGRITYTRNGIEYNVTSGISLVTTGIQASGGESIESITSIKKFAPRIYASQNRALTADDYETLIPSRIYPETESISVFGGEELIPPQYGKVFISIKPRFGDFLPNLVKENIRNRLKKFAVAGIVPEILDLKYLYLEVNSKLYYNSNLAPSSEFVSSVAQSNANKYSESTELNKYGARFKYSKFLKILDDSHESVTSNITTVEMRRDLRVVLNTLTEYQIGFGNEFHIKNMAGYNIKSTAFRVAGLNQNVYISDIPNTNRIDGSLFLFTVPSVNSTNPTVVRRNVGTINYQKGIVTINPINILAGKIKDGQPIIELSAVPHSNDVVGLQDLYLQLDISNSNFEMVVDNIASGLDPSASNYITSSSYANGALVRVTGDIATTSGQRVVNVSNVSATATTRAGSTATTSTTTTTTTTTSTTPSAASGTSSGSSGGSSSSGGSYSY